MVVHHFLKWIDTARVAERAAAAAALSRAYIGHDLPFEDRCAAEAALTLLLDDPSPKVRLSLADALSMSNGAPVHIVRALAEDQPDIAALIIARSPLLADSDLIDRVASCEPRTQALVAMRPRLSIGVCASIAEIGEVAACVEMLNNSGADIAQLSFRRICERHGRHPDVREALLRDARLPSDCRHMLLVQLGEALKTSPLILSLMGKARADRVMREACLRSSLTLIERTGAEEHPALIEHLRLRGELTASFVLRVVAHGKIDFFGAALMALTGQGAGRIRSLLANGRDVALAALLRKAGFAEATHRPILRAIKVWREVANGRRVAGAQEVSWLMLEAVDADAMQAGDRAAIEIAALLKSIHLEALRDNARDHALAIAAA
jgi:uncharacterized protein (DUF2336 family)